MRMRSDLNELQSSTVQLLEAYFQGSLGKKALVGCGTGEQGQAAQPMQWQVGNVEVCVYKCVCARSCACNHGHALMCGLVLLAHACVPGPPAKGALVSFGM
eukprot:791500-Pelagomonas_calceolata.AAC.2